MGSQNNLKMEKEKEKNMEKRGTGMKKEGQPN